MVSCKQHIKNIQRDSDILAGRSDFICLDRNERISSFPKAVLADMLSNVSSKLFTAYPSLEETYGKLSDFTGLAVENICLGAGSDSLIRRAFQAYLRSGEKVLTPEPTYGMYAVWAEVFCAKLVTVKYGPDLKINVDDFISLIDDDTRIVVIVSPDQPTGAVFKANDIRRIASATAQTNSLLIIDEAYYPFHPETAVSLLNDFDHLLIIRSFSKIAGIAGLRVGYALSSLEIVRSLHAVRSPGEVNSMGALAASYLLDHSEILDDFKQDVEKGRKLLVTAANKLGWGVPNCAGNFQLLKLSPEINPENLASLLKKKGYLIKTGFNHDAMLNMVRITLDGPDVIQPFIEILAETIKEISNDANIIS